MPYLGSVNRLLTQKGTTSYSLKATISSGFLDPSNPSKGPSTTSESYSLLSFPGKYKNSQIDGELIKKGDVKLYVSPISPDTSTTLEVTPTTNDIIIDSNDNEWRVKDVDQWIKNDTVVLYVLQIRK